MLDIPYITHANKILLLLTTLCSKKRKFKVLFRKMGLKGTIYREMLVERILNIEPDKDLVTVIEENPINMEDPIRRFKISKIIFIALVKENENGE